MYTTDRKIKDPGEVKEPLYFGCWGETGHYPFSQTLRTLSYDNHLSHWLGTHDGALTPCTRLAQQSQANLFYFRQAIALALHDFTVDDRPGSNALFLLPFFNAQSTEDVVAKAREFFPQVTARIEATNPIHVVNVFYLDK